MQKYRHEKTSKVTDKIAKKYGHEVLRLSPYHCDLNAIELIWADEKNFVAQENTEMTLKSVEELFRKRRAEITAEICRNCVEHVKHVENSYWETDRILDEKLDKLKVLLESREDESDTDTEEEDFMSEDEQIN